MKRRIAMTPKALEARRLSAQHSTGPRTPQGKRRSAANSHPGRAADAGSSALGQKSPELLAGLVKAFEPADPAERLLVEELARLHEAKRHNQEAQEGVIRRSLTKLRRQRGDHQRELTLESSDHPYAMVAAAGFFQMNDCPAKFRVISRLLNTVRDDVELGNFSVEVEELLRMIYGPGPSMRGAMVVGSYNRLLESAFSLGPVRRRTETTDAPLESPDAAAPDAREADHTRASLEASRAQLLRAIDEEKSLLTAKFEAYLEEYIPSPEDLERAALIPTDQVWRVLSQQDQALDRQIENKTRLLLFVQWVRRSREARA
ncbi:MAG: hypothetical protein ABSG54_11540 [Terriglobia bacterium]